MGVSKNGVPPVIIHFRLGFSRTKTIQPAWGSPMESHGWKLPWSTGQLAVLRSDPTRASHFGGERNHRNHGHASGVQRCFTGGGGNKNTEDVTVFQSKSSRNRECKCVSIRNYDFRHKKWCVNIIFTMKQWELPRVGDVNLGILD